jgi:glycosyltransferase involved in cell wall biosynthesis
MRLLIHDYAGHPFQVQLSRELARRGHLVVHAFAGGLLTPRGSLQKKADDPNILELVEVPMDVNYRRDKYRFLRRRQMEVEYGRAIAALIVEKKPELVISANTPTEPQLRIANTCSRLEISFVPWIQDFYSVAVARLAKKKLPVIGNLISWWYRHLERATLRQAAAVIAITDDFMPLLQQFGVASERIEVIPNWAPLEELPVRPRRNAWSATHGLDDQFVFLYTGTLAMKHNPELLWQLALAFEADPGVQVVVISEGPGAEYLTKKMGEHPTFNIQSPTSNNQQDQQAANNNPAIQQSSNPAAKPKGALRVLPFQPFSDMPEVLASADVLVAVLEADAGVFSVPSKVLTYQCAGKPLLAAMPSGNLAARLIAKEGSGICVEPDNLTGFLNAARELREDAALRQRCGEKARAYAERHFDIQKIADRFEEIAKRQAPSARR